MTSDSISCILTSSPEQVGLMGAHASLQMDRSDAGRPLSDRERG